MHKKSHRKERLGEELKKILGQAFLEDIKDPRIGFVTITKVDVTRDLSHAKVYISVLDEKDEADTMAALNKAKGHLRSIAASQLDLRVAPEFTFIADESLAHSMKINRLLKEISDED